MRLETDMVEEIKSRMNLIEEFQADGREFEKVGANHMFNCPFHSENTASCSVHFDYFRCMGCGAKGDAISYLSLVKFQKEKVEGREFIEVLREGCLRVGIEFEGDKKQEPEKPKTVYSLEKIKECCKFQATGNKETVVFNESQNPDTSAVEFIEARFESTVKKRSNGKPAKRFLQCAPIDGGFIFGLVKGRKTPLFNRKGIRENDMIVFVEGFKCMKLLWSIGICATCAAGGSNNPASNVDLEPLRGKTVAIWPDNDDGGKDFASEFERELCGIDCAATVIDIADLNLEPKDDVVDYFARLTGTPEEKKARILEIIQTAKPETVQSQIQDEINGVRFAIRHPSFYALSSTLCFLPKSMTILCASPGVSKSFLISQWVWQMFFDGTPCSLYALESGNVLHERRMLAQMAGNAQFLNFEWVKTHTEECAKIFDTFGPMLAELKKNKVIQAPKFGVELTTAHLLAHIANEAKDGRKFVAIDPITKLSTDENFWKEQQKFVWKANELCQKTDVRLLLVTHPKKGAQGVHMDNLSGSVAFQQNPDSVFWLTEHDDLFQAIQNPMNPMQSEQKRYNRTMRLLKTRLGPAAKKSIGYFVDWTRLIHDEIGFVDNVEKTEI